MISARPKRRVEPRLGAGSPERPTQRSCKCNLGAVMLGLCTRDSTPLIKRQSLVEAAACCRRRFSTCVLGLYVCSPCAVCGVCGACPLRVGRWAGARFPRSVCACGRKRGGAAAAMGVWGRRAGGRSCGARGVAGQGRAVRARGVVGGACVRRAGRVVGDGRRALRRSAVRGGVRACVYAASGA